jgi:predicted secreted protein
MSVGAAQAAVTGEDTKLGILGFSPDGRYVAFEDFGSEGESDFKYSEISVVDSVADRLVGIPIRVRSTDENEPVKTTRAQNVKKAGAALSGVGIVLGDEGAAPAMTHSKDAFGVVRFDLAGSAYELQLSTQAVADKGCHHAIEGSVAFTLSLKKDGKRRSLHDETRVPKSRGAHGCIVDYDIEAVRAQGRTLAVFLRVAAPGFEAGIDYSHIVVTLRDY